MKSPSSMPARGTITTQITTPFPTSFSTLATSSKKSGCSAVYTFKTHNLSTGVTALLHYFDRMLACQLLEPHMPADNRYDARLSTNTPIELK